MYITACPIKARRSTALDKWDWGMYVFWHLKAWGCSIPSTARVKCLRVSKQLIGRVDLHPYQPPHLAAYVLTDNTEVHLSYYQLFFGYMMKWAILLDSNPGVVHGASVQHKKEVAKYVAGSSGGSGTAAGLSGGSGLCSMYLYLRITYS